MKYYRDLFSQLKINITIPIPKVSIFACHVIMIFYFIITFSNQFTTYPSVIALIKVSFIFCIQDKVFIKVLFYFLSAIMILLKNYFNKLIARIFSSAKNDWLGWSIVNADNFLRKSTRNMFLTFFGIRGITIFIVTLNHC